MALNAGIIADTAKESEMRPLRPVADCCYMLIMRPLVLHPWGAELVELS